VSEVVLGVQFAKPVVDLDALATFGLRVRDELPGRSQQDPLPRVQETFAAQPEPRTIRFQVMPGSVLPRAWFISADDRQLVQLQADRFVFNWRRMGPDDRYPRYAELRPTFERHLATLRECLTDAGKQRGTVRGLRVVRDLSADGFLPTPEDTTLQTRFRIPDPAGGETPAGRLYVSAEPALRSADLTPIYLLKMTAHIVSAMPDDSSVVRALDLGREWAVRAFEQLTTTELRETWHPVANRA
jgi:hypothetical protein